MAERQGGHSSLILSAVGIVGALLGGAMQHYLTLDRTIEERQREAFTGFLNALDKSRVARQLEDAGNKEQASNLNVQFELEGGAALRRMAVYGDKDVVAAVAEWSRSGQTRLAECPAHWKSDLNVWESMRRHSLGRWQSVSPRDLGELALFCRPPNGQ
jgi:hypothetical protein